MSRISNFVSLSFNILKIRGMLSVNQNINFSVKNLGFRKANGSSYI